MIGTLAPTIEQEIKAVITARALPFTIDRCDVRDDLDHDGDGAVFNDVSHPLLPTPVDPRLLIEVTHAVRDHLYVNRRDPRFPYIWQHFAEGQTFGSVT